MSAPKIYLALPIDDGSKTGFWRSLLKLMYAPPVSMEVAIVDGDSLVSRARNTLSARFIQSDCTHLLFIDSDLVFSPEQITRIIGHDEPIVAGFYPKKAEGDLTWVCNALPGEAPDARGLQRVRYMGTGFMLIKREVFEAMIAAYPIEYDRDEADGIKEWDFWSVGIYPGTRRYLSEDWYFCQRALDLGFTVWADVKVILKHIGQVTFPLKAQEEAHFGKDPVPAAEEARNERPAGLATTDDADVAATA